MKGLEAIGPEPCDDCGADAEEINEYYMVQGDLWKQARRNPVNGKPELPVTSQLCTGCLEDRLGRKLGIGRLYVHDRNP
jgi:hypothetical protein